MQHARSGLDRLALRATSGAVLCALVRFTLDLISVLVSTGQWDGWGVCDSSSPFWRYWGAIMRKESTGIRDRLRLWVSEICEQRVQLIHHGSAQNTRARALQVLDICCVCSHGCSSSRFDYWIILLPQYVNGSGKWPIKSFNTGRTFRKHW